MTLRHRLGMQLLLCWIGLGAACSDAGPTLSPLVEGDVILAFGDSLTFGTGAQVEHAYPTVLAELSGFKVVKSGVPGELSAAGLTRLKDVLDAVQPRLLLLCHAGNDLLRKRSLAQAQKNLEAMIKLAQERDIEVLLLGVPKPGIWLSTAEIYSAAATATDIPLEPDALASILSEAGLKSDPVHPNAAGYRELAQSVHQRLIDLGAL